MNNDDFARSGFFLFGKGWMTPLSAVLNVSERTIKRWVSGERDIPDGVADDMILFIRAKVGDIEERYWENK